jgi:hypothetical protein
MSRIALTLTTLALAATAVNCTALGYTGPRRPSSSVGYVRGYWWGVNIISVDGYSVDRFPIRNRPVEVPAGEREFLIRGTVDTSVGTTIYSQTLRSQSLDFRVEPTHTYTIRRRVDARDPLALFNVEVFDETLGQIVPSRLSQ